jgi:hypothetical protein
MRWNHDRARANIRQATTEDLMDRATVFRKGMEEEALDLIERELRERQVTAADLAAHEKARQANMILAPDGLPLRCRNCSRPAVQRTWELGRLFGLVPMFPRLMAYCEEHAPSTGRPCQSAGPRESPDH